MSNETVNQQPTPQDGMFVHHRDCMMMQLGSDVLLATIRREHPAIIHILTHKRRAEAQNLDEIQARISASRLA